MAELRLDVLTEPLRSGETVADVCRRYGISRDTYYRYRRRYLADGLEGLEDQSRRPKTSPAQIPAEVEIRIVEMRRDHPRWGARRIRAELIRAGVEAPAVSTVHQVLRRNGLVAPQPPRRPRADKRFEREVTNDLWHPTSLEPWPDQWRFLSSVARIDPEAVASLAESLRPVASGPAMGLADLLSDDGPRPPPVVRARLGAGLSIERTGLPPALVAALKHLASIQNPQFYEKQHMRFSTWDTPRFIRCYEEDLEWLHLPRGLVERTGELLAEIGSSLDAADVRPSPESIPVRFRSELRAQQREAVAAVEPHERGVIVAPPGAGKTVMACAVIAHHQTPTLILVDRKPLVEQWTNRLCDHLGIDESRIGVIGGGKTKPTGFVDVAMIQTLARQDDPADTFSNYGLVVVDECHHIPAVSFEACVRRAPSRRWLGLTATPYRRDGLEGIIALQCGPVRHEIRPVDAEGVALVNRELVVHETDTTVSEDEAREIHTVLSAVAEDEERTAQICQDVQEAVVAGRTCLVLTQRTSHIDALVAGLAEMGTPALVLRGGLGKKARQAVADAIASRSPDEGIVLVATGSYLGEGFDWPELDTLFLAFPIAFKGRVVQYVGRLLRAHEDKLGVQLHDYVDVEIPVLNRMHTKRIPAYRTLGFDIPRTRRR